MTKEAIKEHVTAAPFRPFSVRLTDGRAYAVPGPDYGKSFTQRTAPDCLH